MLFEHRSVTGLTLEYEKRLTPLKNLAAAAARPSVVAPFTSSLLLAGLFNAVEEKGRLNGIL